MNVSNTSSCGGGTPICQIWYAYIKEQRSYDLDTNLHRQTKVHGTVSWGCTHVPNIGCLYGTWVHPHETVPCTFVMGMHPCAKYRMPLWQRTKSYDPGMNLHRQTHRQSDSYPPPQLWLAKGKTMNLSSVACNSMAGGQIFFLSKS